MDDFEVGQPADLGSLSTRIARVARLRGGWAAGLLVKSLAKFAAALGRFDVIESWLAHVPEERIQSDPALLYWSAASMVLKRPGDAYPRFLRAFEMQHGQPTTSIAVLTWAGLLDAIFLIYRDMREVDAFLPWMTPEREDFVDRAPTPVRALVVASVLFALAFRAPTHPRIGAWRLRAERLVEANPTSDLSLRLSAALILDYTWQGNLTSAEILWKRFVERAARTELSPMSQAMQCLNEATLRLHQGRLPECLDAVARGLANSRALGVRIWDGVMRCHGVTASLGLGDMAGAKIHLDAVADLFAEGHPADEAFYRGMLLWHSFLAGDTVGVLSRVSAAIDTTDQKGVPYFMAVGRLISAVVLHEAGHRERAQAVLDEGLAIGREVGNPVIAWAGGLFSAHMHFDVGDHVRGDEELRAALLIGRDHSLSHFFAWPRAILVRLIDRALTRQYFPEYLAHLTELHRFVPGDAPTQSDLWAFDARVYSFGDARVVREGKHETLSTQLIRQVELLALLIGRSGKPYPFHALATRIYGHGDAEALGALKRVLHSLRDRLGKGSIVLLDGVLSIDFTKVWIDACSFRALRALPGNPVEVESWLDRHYHGHFMERVQGSQIVEELRNQFAAYARQAVTQALGFHSQAGDSASLSRLTARWESLFPEVFHRQDAGAPPQAPPSNN